GIARTRGEIDSELCAPGRDLRRLPWLGHHEPVNCVVSLRFGEGEAVFLSLPGVGARIDPVRPGRKYRTVGAPGKLLSERDAHLAAGHLEAAKVGADRRDLDAAVPRVQLDDVADGGIRSSHCGVPFS